MVPWTSWTDLSSSSCAGGAGGWIGGVGRCALLGSKEERLVKALGGGVTLLGCSVGELLGLGGAR